MLQNYIYIVQVESRSIGLFNNRKAFKHFESAKKYFQQCIDEIKYDTKEDIEHKGRHNHQDTTEYTTILKRNGSYEQFTITLRLIPYDDNEGDD